MFEKRSQYFGVFSVSGSKKWLAQRIISSKPVSGGLFEKEIDAAKAADDLLRKPGIKPHALHKFNFPDKVTKSSSFTEFEGEKGREFGVSYSKDKKKWLAHRTQNGKLKTIGPFDSKHEAMVASDDLWKKIGGDPNELNFPVLLPSYLLVF